jgi:hypothetical protein
MVAPSNLSAAPVTAPIRADFSGWKADDGTRTHDTWLGKPVLYQLSYVRL